MSGRVHPAGEGRAPQHGTSQASVVTQLSLLPGGAGDAPCDWSPATRGQTGVRSQVFAWPALAVMGV